MPDNAAAMQAAEKASHRPAAHAWWRPPLHAPFREGVDLADAVFGRAIFETFAQMAQRRPDASAIESGTRRINYANLRDQAVSLAARIDAAAGRGAAVATLLADPVDAACAVLACLAAGRPCITLNTQQPPERLADILADAGVGAVVLAAQGSPCPIPAGATTVRFGAFEAPAAARALQPAPMDAPAIIVYTSGSTGRPKGIVRSQRQTLVRVVHRIVQFRMNPGDGKLLLYPISSGPGITACLATLLSGGVLHVADVSVLGARGVLDLARDAAVTSISCVPVLLRLLFAMDGASEAFSTLRFVYSTSESLFRPDVERWRSVLPAGCHIRTGYGLTEGAPLAEWFVPADPPGDSARLPIGYPIPWCELAITDPAGDPVDEGELWARGRLLSLGEWRRGRCEPGRLLPDADDAEGAILRTGDLVRMRPDGLLEFLGRIDDQVRIRGNRVEPAEVQRVLRETPGIADAAILVRRGAADPVLVAFVAPDGAAEPALRQSATHRMSTALPSYMIPARLHVVLALPKLPGGKVDPAALMRLDDAALAKQAD